MVEHIVNFCEEPWNGLFSVNTNGDVFFCHCYAKIKIGNTREATVSEIWNAPVLVGIRECFGAGKIPPQCAGQLCPTVVKAGKSGMDV